jgi:hypothetical protein
MAEVKQVKIPKAKLYKMVSYKGSVGSGGAQYTPLTAAKAMGDLQISVKSLLSGINSLGATLNSVALTTEKIAESMAASVNSQIRNADKIGKVEAKIRGDENKQQAKELTEKKKQQARENRDEAEANSKKKPGKFQVIRKEFKEQTKKAFGGLFGALARIAGFFLKYFVIFGILDWLSKNPEKVQRLAKGLAALGKFIYKVSSFLVGSAFDGISKFLENPISLKGFFGAVQFILSAAPLFVGMAFLKNPVATTKAVFSLLKLIGGGMMNMLKAGKAVFGGRFGKIAGVVGAGAATAMAISASGGSNAEAIGGGVGAGAGTAVGQALGSKLGPAGSMIGGAVGGLAGGAIGQAVGPMLAPLTKPIGDFFKMVGDFFMAAIAPLKDGATEFFKALGGFMTTILDAIKPHLPFIKKMIALNMKIAFAPLLLGIKALTAVLKFFTPKNTEDRRVEGKAGGGKVKAPVTLPQASAGGEMMLQARNFLRREESFFSELIDALMEPDGIIPLLKEIFGIVVGIIKNPMGSLTKAAGSFVGGAWSAVTGFLGFAEGGQVPGGGFASGGWISGPQSGYPVSLDGGRSTSFIGHGTEWVGYKGFAKGGAFVVPFDTPATKKNPGLTGLRMRQAASGGYGMPGFSMGGAIRPTLKGFAEGGKVQFSPTEYNKDSISSDKVTVGDKSYIMRYKEDAGNVTMLQMNKIVSDNFWKPDDLTGVNPTSAEWKAVTGSEAWKKYLAKKHGKYNRQSKSHSYNLKKMTTAKQAEIAFFYNRSYQDNYNAWKKQGVTDEEARAYAARAATEFALTAKDSQGDVITALPGAKDDVTGETLAGVAPEAMKEVEVTPPASDEGKDKNKKGGMDLAMESLEKALSTFGSMMKDANAPGTQINEAKLKEEDLRVGLSVARNEALKSAMAQRQAIGSTAPISVGSAGEEQPLVIPNWAPQEAEPYLSPKFGLVADFRNDMTDLM